MGAVYFKMDNIWGMAYKKQSICLSVILVFFLYIGTLCGCGKGGEYSNDKLMSWMSGALAIVVENEEEREAEGAEESYEEQNKQEPENEKELEGNQEESRGQSIKITVFEDSYFYENHVVPYEELMVLLDDLKEEDVVTVYDDNAALNAYQKLITVLEEREISYIVPYE